VTYLLVEVDFGIPHLVGIVAANGQRTINQAKTNAYSPKQVE